MVATAWEEGYRSGKYVIYFSPLDAPPEIMRNPCFYGNSAQGFTQLEGSAGPGASGEFDFTEERAKASSFGPVQREDGYGETHRFHCDGRSSSENYFYLMPVEYDRKKDSLKKALSKTELHLLSRETHHGTYPGARSHHSRGLGIRAQ